MTREREENLKDAGGTNPPSGEVLDIATAGSLRSTRFADKLLNPVRVGLVSLPEIIRRRPKDISAPTILKYLKNQLGFKEEKHHHILHDTINFVRRDKKGEKVSYIDRLRHAGESGKNEAASWGKIHINGKDATLFGMNLDFLLGTLGSAVGQTFYEAAKHAGEKKELFVAVFSSAGARQDEGNPGLLQMPRMNRAIDTFKKKTNAPYVAVLSGEVWGGISASTVPVADVIVGVRGTNFGFAGPKVIEGYSLKAVDEGAQSVEAHSAHRNIHVLVDDEKHLVNWLKQFERITNMARNKKVPSIAPTAPELPNGLGNIEKKGASKEDLYEQFMDLKKNADRPDGKYMIENVFDTNVPMYSSLETDDLIQYPAVIASLATIDSQVFLVLANQPSYQKTNEGLKKISASPTPADYTYVQDMLEFGERLGVPVVSFIDTLGAKPTIDAENAGQSRAIAKTTTACNSYKYPFITIVNGFGGSGGAVATMGIVDSLSMLEDSMLAVAEPQSSASIVFRTPSPTTEQIKDTIPMLKMTAQDQMERGLIDDVIVVPDGNSQRNAGTVKAVRDHIRRTYPPLEEMRKHRKLERFRDRRMEKLEGMPLRKTT